MGRLPALRNGRYCLLQMFSGNLTGSLVQLIFTGTHLTWAGDVEIEPFQGGPVAGLLLRPEAVTYFPGGKEECRYMEV